MENYKKNFIMMENEINELKIRLNDSLMSQNIIELRLEEI